MSEEENYEFLYKVVVTGDSGVGKTNIITRFTSGEFYVGNKATIGVEFGHAEVSLPDGVKVKVQIWDTAGQERFRAITRGYYRGAVGALIVYDITKATSFANVEKWIKELNEHADSDIVIMLVGNKTDLKASREVSTEDARKFAQKNNLLVIETSALDGENIQTAFTQTISAIYDKKKPAPTDRTDPSPNGNRKIPTGETIRVGADTPAPVQKKGCC